jgi:queuosine precursor transporter
MTHVAVYIVAVVTANLAVAAFNPTSVCVNAVLFIRVTLTTRDRLHDLWSGQRLVLNMEFSIVKGALLSRVINQDAGRIAAASTYEIPMTVRRNAWGSGYRNP